MPEIQYLWEKQCKLSYIDKYDEGNISPQVKQFLLRSFLWIEVKNKISFIQFVM